MGKDIVIVKDRTFNLLTKYKYSNFVDVVIKEDKMLIYLNCHHKIKCLDIRIL